ncbi:MAG TPA: hypothetical protein VJ826_09130 [Candidatus Polarisedimenticolaceae bacterium]|nr:hypothetical protein [Candidatus Polarisedimenticolaceae bacterium]
MSLSIRRQWAAAVCAATIALSASAQETQPAPSSEEPKPDTPPPAAEAPPPPAKPKWPVGDPPLHRWGGLTIAVDAWGPELANENYDVAVFSSPGQYPRVLSMPSDASTRLHWKVWYHLPKDFGSLRFEYDSMRDESDLQVFDTGNFAYFELLTVPGFSGLSDDGLVDGFSAESTTKTREMRIEYERVVFDSPRSRGAFHVGYRNVDHSRELEATYYSLLPAFPPFLPPNFPENYNPLPLFPNPDFARETSDFSGHGLGGGLDVEFKLHPRVSIVTGLTIGVVRGAIDTTYQSLTNFYFLRVGEQIFLIDFQDVVDIINSDGPNNSPTDFVGQSASVRAAALKDRSRLAYELDISLGAQFKIWRSLNATLGLRELAYVDVGASARPSVFGELQDKSFTAGYGGYFFGLSYRF